MQPMTALAPIGYLPQLSWCDTEDIGGAAAAVIAGGPERWADKAVGVAGEHASLEEVAARLSRLFGKLLRMGCCGVGWVAVGRRRRYNAWRDLRATWGTPHTAPQLLGACACSGPAPASS